MIEEFLISTALLVLRVTRRRRSVRYLPLSFLGVYPDFLLRYDPYEERLKDHMTRLLLMSLAVGVGCLAWIAFVKLGAVYFLSGVGILILLALSVFASLLLLAYLRFNAARSGLARKYFVEMVDATGAVRTR